MERVTALEVETAGVRSTGRARTTERNVIGNLVGSYNDAVNDAMDDLEAGRLRGREILVPAASGG